VLAAEIRLYWTLWNVVLYLANGLGSIRLVPSEMRPDTARNKIGPCHVSPSGLRRSPVDFYIFVFHKFCIFTYKLFNIIKFELKIHDFTLNNVIKIFYIIFCGG
jgi:hypothetical protein